MNAKLTSWNITQADIAALEAQCHELREALAELFDNPDDGRKALAYLSARHNAERILAKYPKEQP